MPDLLHFADQDAAVREARVQNIAAVPRHNIHADKSIETVLYNPLMSESRIRSQE
jgi:hypothetical protein